MSVKAYSNRRPETENGKQIMSGIDEYRRYRKSRRPGDPYFPEGTENEDEYFFLEERVFVWDKAKNASNKAVHGIDFYTAAYVFNDEFKLEDENLAARDEDRRQAVGEPKEPTDPKHPIDTQRSRPRAVIGEVEGVLFVVYVLGTGDFGKETRIISARAADRDEVSAYFDMKYI